MKEMKIPSGVCRSYKISMQILVASASFGIFYFQDLKFPSINSFYDVQKFLNVLLIFQWNYFSLLRFVPRVRVSKFNYANIFCIHFTCSHSEPKSHYTAIEISWTLVENSQKFSKFKDLLSRETVHRTNVEIGRLEKCGWDGKACVTGESDLEIVWWSSNRNFSRKCRTYDANRGCRGNRKSWRTFADFAEALPNCRTYHCLPARDRANFYGGRFT